MGSWLLGQSDGGLKNTLHAYLAGVHDGLGLEAHRGARGDGSAEHVARGQVAQGVLVLDVGRLTKLSGPVSLKIFKSTPLFVKDALHTWVPLPAPGGPISTVLCYVGDDRSANLSYAPARSLVSVLVIAIRCLGKWLVLVLFPSQKSKY